MFFFCFALFATLLNIPLLHFLFAVPQLCVKPLLDAFNSIAATSSANQPTNAVLCSAMLCVVQHAKYSWSCVVVWHKDKVAYYCVAAGTAMPLHYETHSAIRIYWLTHSAAHSCVCRECIKSLRHYIAIALFVVRIVVVLVAVQIFTTRGKRPQKLFVHTGIRRRRFTTATPLSFYTSLAHICVEHYGSVAHFDLYVTNCLFTYVYFIVLPSRKL